MNCKTALETIESADTTETILIYLSKQCIKLNRNKINYIDSEDGDTVYIHDKQGREHYIYAPSIEAILIC